MARDRRMVLCVLAVVAVVAGCGDGSTLTDLTMSLPEGDREAARRLVGLRVEVWPPERQACRTLIGWRRVVCGEACTPAPSPRTAGFAPDAEVMLRRTGDGAFAAANLRVPGRGPWEVVVHGTDETGSAFLYGCQVVASGEPADVALFRPWCDIAACAGQLHPACPAEIDCTADPGDDPDGIGAPVCRPTAAVVFAWEEDGVACPPPDGVDRYAPCQQARVVCELGRLEPEEDGVCPDLGAEMCGATIEGDLDCDGTFPGPCGSCTAGARMACGDGTCAPTATCEAGGTWGACTPVEGTAEACGGGDQDCDGILDDADPDALAACNTERPASRPVADRCAPGGCTCGGGAACGGTTSCCGGACLDTDTSDLHCGGCGRRCPTGQRCSASMCVPAVDAGPGCTVAACNEERPEGRPGSDRCSPEGMCRCGGSAPCGEARVCCMGTCQDSCAPPDGGTDACVAGEETCGGGDEDCDETSDALDPDALSWCNREREDDEPAADGCDGDGCRCGDMPACEDGEGCCGPADGRTCVPLNTAENCGGCGNPCEAPGSCATGTCLP